MAKKVIIGIIGCGTIANDAHIPSYMDCEDAEVKYFCDIIPERAEAAVERYGRGIACTDYHDVINDPEVEAISVCTPNNMHPVISIDALRAGKQVLCEKPAARTYAEALEMQKVQHETGNTLNIGVVNRFNMAVNKIKEIIDAGELGEIYHVYVSFRAHRSIPGLGGAFTTKAIAGGGVLIDWGVHFLDIVMYCTGDPEPLSVSGKGFCKLGVDMPNYVYDYMWAKKTMDLNGTYDVDDFVSAFVRTSGPTISLNGAWAQNIGVEEKYIDFMGTKGGIRLQYGGDFVVYTTKDGALYEYTPEYDTESNMFQNEINSFVRCVRTGEKLASHIDRNILTSRLMQGIYDSSETGKEVIY
ncbi:MAG: Gfo/Idh/MocA family oxidoreductase [Ruminococcaceae bacterium]|nr:Gfo/Idh/MocA family oxidoreductase [Oscillospiraceae bacterium]